ncbi:MAG: hypothetical protein GY913_25635 [Proteobacteria bacterium]|nr:hypothetical protein [Pseudomonadota bacterium]MCP4920297.1 hypothetical protein [Pseudomonadota bacterium]
MRRLLARLAAALEHRHAPWFIIATAILLASPSIATPLVIDDLIFGARAGVWSGWPGLSDPATPFFVFSEGTPENHAAQVASGIHSWWAPPDFKLALWRPLAALDLHLDFALWPEHPPLMFVHSLAWFAALLAALWHLYRRLLPRRAALFALAVYGFDDARGFVHGLISHRNAVIATLFGVLCVIAHDRWRRDGWTPGAVLAPVLLGLGLLGGEMAISATGLLFAYTLLIDRGPRRVRALLPCAAVSLVWLAAYAAGGWGASGSGLYTSPFEDPARFVFRLVEQAPVLLAAQFGITPSDAMVLLLPEGRFGWWLLALGTMGLLAYATRALWSESSARFWALSTAIAVLPISGSFASDRLLVFVGVGASGLLGLLFHRALDEDPWPKLIGALVFIHLVKAPLLVPLRSLTMRSFDEATAPVEDWVAAQPGIEDKTLIVAGAAADGVAIYSMVHLAADDRPRPQAIRVLWTGLDPVQVDRTGPNTLVVRPDSGFLALPMEQMVRSPSIPFIEGEVIDLGDLVVTVTEVEDGRALEAEMTFTEPLDDRRWAWMRVGIAGPEAWSAPAVGQTRMEPSLLD